MADSIRFSFNDVDAQRALDQLGKRAPVAIARALNRTAGSVRTVMSREVSKDIGLKVGTVRDAMNVRLARTDAQTAAITIGGARIALSKFMTDGALKRLVPSRGRGTVRARIGGKSQTYPGAFVAKLDSGHVGVFRRVRASTRKSSGAWSKNLPMTQLFGPSLPQVFGKHLGVGIARGEEQLAKNLEHEIGFELSQART